MNISAENSLDLVLIFQIAQHSNEKTEQRGCDEVLDAVSPIAIRVTPITPHTN